MSNTPDIPAQVELEYHRAGNTHIFSSVNIDGLVHVGSQSLESAFEKAISALNQHISHIHNCEVNYKTTTTVDQIRQLASIKSKEINWQVKLSLETSLSNCH